MRGAAGTGDDDFDAAFFRVGRVFKKQVGGAVGGDAACFMWNTEGLKCFGDELHGIPVGAGAHDDADERMGDCAFSVGGGPLAFCLDCICQWFRTCCLSKGAECSASTKPKSPNKECRDEDRRRR